MTAPDPADRTAAPRLARDSMGEVTIPPGVRWGAQTQRAIEHFAIGGEPMPLELIHALARLKGCAAAASASLGRLDGDLAGALQAAADEVAAGVHDAHFPLSIWQSGSGTQTNMNVNEVIASLAGERLGRVVHPNDDVNRGQSSNDMIPSAMHLAAVTAVRQRLAPALAGMDASLAALAERHAALAKMGRTHLQDAVPMTFGQEAGAWRSQLAAGAAALAHAMPAVHALAVGGTAVGTGLNTHPDFGARVCAELAARTGWPFVPAADRFAALAGHEPLVALHGALKVLAVALSKLANDVRLLGSGPRGGLAELQLPANEPGSSIMPGKVNPTQCEALAMVCWQVVGNDTAVTMGAAAGHLQLNTAKPLIAHNVLRSVRLLADAAASFDRHTLQGLVPDERRMAALLHGSLMLATALAPHVGYDRAAHVAHRAHADGTTLREAAQAEGIAAEDFDRWVDPARMLGPEAADAPSGRPGARQGP